MSAAPLSLLVFAIAALYASAGFGGATGYLAAMSFFGIPPQAMASTALLLNVMVAGISFLSFYRAGHLQQKLLLPFIVTSVPAAFMGGYFMVSEQIYFIVLYAVLTLVAVRLLFFSKRMDVSDSCSSPPFVLAGLTGLIVGLLSGMVGIGGGVFLSPIILFAHWGTAKQASAVAAAFIVLNSLGGLAGRLMGSNLAFDSFTVVLLPFGLVGALLGSQLGAKCFSNLSLRRALGTVMSIAVTNFWIKLLG